MENNTQKESDSSSYMEEFKSLVASLGESATTFKMSSVTNEETNEKDVVVNVEKKTEEVINKKVKETPIANNTENTSENGYTSTPEVITCPFCGHRTYPEETVIYDDTYDDIEEDPLLTEYTEDSPIICDKDLGDDFYEYPGPSFASEVLTESGDITNIKCPTCKKTFVVECEILYHTYPFDES